MAQHQNSLVTKKTLLGVDPEVVLIQQGQDSSHSEYMILDSAFGVYIDIVYERCRNIGVVMEDLLNHTLKELAECLQTKR